MELIDLIKKYREQLETIPSDYNCLLFALQIPSICSRIEFPQTHENTGKGDGKFYRENGNPCDKNMYKAWLVEHCASFADIYYASMELNTFCDAVYRLRCKMTHEGILMTDNSHFYFTNDDNAMCIGDIIFLPMKRLCEDMFDVAITVLFNRNEKFNVTLFKDIFLTDNIYSKIRDDLEETYKLFWNEYSGDDKLLNWIYDHIIFDNPDVKSHIDKFFKIYPDDNFEIWDFGLKYGYVEDIPQRFIKKKYDSNKSKISQIANMDSDVLCLTKTEYERMLQVHEELGDFSKEHPFDIARYLRGD